jgi:hypothetical protein
MESELLVEMLPLRMPKGELPATAAGEAPERPKVVTESRRRWSCAAATDTDWRPVPLPEVELLRWNKLENAAEVTEPRRSLGGPWFELSLDMLTERKKESRVEVCNMVKGPVRGDRQRLLNSGTVKSRR